MANPHAVEADRLLTKATGKAEGFLASSLGDGGRDLGPRVAIAYGILVLCGIGRAILAGEE